MVLRRKQCVCRLYTGLALSLCLSSIIASHAISNTYDYPQLAIQRSVAPNVVEGEEWSTVTVTVSGDTREQTEPVPISLVLALDYSGSMKADSAYIAVAEAANAVIGLLRESIDWIAVLAIRETAEVVVPLTTNFSGIDKTLNGLLPGGGTNLVDAFDQANDQLEGATTPVRVVLLMSDGLVWPTQWDYIFDNLPGCEAHGIQYFTAAYGEEPATALLKIMVEKTRGLYFEAPKPEELKEAFESILEAARSSLSLRGITITEVVSPDLEVRPNSLDAWWERHISGVATGIIPEFGAALQAAEAAFYSTKTLVVPEIPFLGKGDSYRFSFDVSGRCQERIPTILEVSDLLHSYVTYSNGSSSPVLTKAPNASLTIEPCGVALLKTWNEDTDVVILELRNDYPRAIKDVRIIENSSEFFRISNVLSPTSGLLALSESTAVWHFDSVAAGRSVLFEVQLEPSPYALSGAVPSGSGPYPLDGPDAATDYHIDKVLFAVDPEDKQDYATLADGLEKTGVTDAMVVLFSNHGYTIQSGAPISPVVAVVSYSPLEMVLGTAETGNCDSSGAVGCSHYIGEFCLRKCNDTYQVLRTTWEYEFFPQEYTSQDYEFTSE